MRAKYLHKLFGILIYANFVFFSTIYFFNHITILQMIITWLSELNLSIPVHFSSLISKMRFLKFLKEMFTLAISWMITSYLPWFRDLTFQVPMQYCSLQHQTLFPSQVTSTTRHCFALALFLHSSGVISPLISSSILGTCQPGEFIFQCLIFCLFILFIVFEAGHHYLHYLHHSLAPGKQQGGNTASPINIKLN